MLLGPFFSSLENYDVVNVRKQMCKVFSNKTEVKMCYPFDNVREIDSFFEDCLHTLGTALHGLERRTLICIEGASSDGCNWIGTMGNYFGTFNVPFLNIAATCRLVHMRFHEFYRINENKVDQVQVIWDIPELMMQANSWPMAPQLGSFMCTPGPLTCDGVNIEGGGDGHALAHVQTMLEDMSKHPSNPDPAIMQLEKYWHPNFNWYGPCGIGTSRGIKGFRNIHQIPFLRAMPDRRLDMDAGLKSNWISQGNYVCETGWPNMRLTLSNDGWLGLNPSGVEIKMRSLDFWRLEDGLIRENWVLIDLLDVYEQLGVDVFDRMSALPIRM